MRGKKGRGAPGGGNSRFPFVGFADIGERHGGEPLGRLQDARKIFRALNVAREPVQIIGGARKHLTNPVRTHATDRRPGHRSSTQVSLVPPPWLEFTTSEPCLSATRVSPPG